MKKLIVVAGGGIYPRMVVEGAKRAGVEKVDVLAVRGSTERATRKAADETIEIGIGEIATGIRKIAERSYDGAILAGQVNPLSLFRSRFDDLTKAWLAELPVKTAHTVFGKLVEKFSEAGVKILPASLYMDDCVPGEGALTKRLPTAEEREDLRHAVEVAGDMGIHDVGQTVMVKSGMVLAVEAFEGTNAAIRRGGKLGGKGSVVFKAARRGHDMRFDIPVVGLKTLKVMKRAGVTALGFQAGRLIMLEREKVVRFADVNSIAIVGFDSDLEAAPLRP
ncbi:MAG: UDP-2,3-diacylglucosamine diphosphatase LpxI [Kiritimatiellae bacterium]|nr:UDP-2,3-diacylglucosamine diphosphatase LpxI [Kiritimatiellia bacterium]